jgi:glycerophosphoryl diester phosphodiesterase
VRPENTLSAFHYALEQGVDTLEMDLNVTKDNVLVVVHDPFLNPDICLDAKGKKLEKSVMIRSLTLKELKTYDCGSLVNPRFPEQVVQPRERIPTFDELLTWLNKEKNPRAKTIMLNVETKSEEAHPEYAPDPKTFAKMVLSMMKKHKVFKRCVLQSFDFRTLVAAREIDSSTVISALIEDRPRESVVEMATKIKANIVSPNHEWLTKDDVDSLHRAGIKVLPWTPNTEREWKKLLAFGVDGMISDNPKALLEFRSKN